MIIVFCLLGIAAFILGVALISTHARRSGRQRYLATARLVAASAGARLLRPAQVAMAVLACDVAASEVLERAAGMAIPDPVPPAAGVPADAAIAAVQQSLHELADGMSRIQLAASRLGVEPAAERAAAFLLTAGVPARLATPDVHDYLRGTLAADAENTAGIGDLVDLVRSGDLRGSLAEGEANRTGPAWQLLAESHSSGTPVDPRAHERGELLGRMAGLGFDDPAGSHRYYRLAGEYDTRLQSLAQTYAAGLTAAMSSQRIRLSKLTRAPARPAAAAVVAELQSATRAYLSCVRRQLASVASFPEWTQDAALVDAGSAVLASLEKTADAVDRCSQLTAAGQLIPALSAITEDPLVADPSWPPAGQFRQACATAARQLLDLSDGWQREAREWLLDGVLPQLSQSVANITDEAAPVTQRWRSGREQAWAELESAADDLVGEVARDLLSDESMAAGAEAQLPVQACMALIQAEDATASQFVHTVRDLIPSPEQVQDVDSGDQLNRLLVRLEQGSIVLAGIDGVLGPLLGAFPDGGAGLAEAWHALAPVPGDAIGSLYSVVQAALHPEAGVRLSTLAIGTVENLVHGALPPTTPAEGLSDAALHYLGHHGLVSMGLPPEVAERFGSLPVAMWQSWAAQNPDMQAAERLVHGAADHIGSAAHLAGPDLLLHGVVGHLPFITIGLSTYREIKLLKADKTTGREALKNIGIDAVGVGAGVGAAAAAGFVIGVHGGPLVVLAVPGAMIGRMIANKVKGGPLKAAMESYAELESRYDARWQRQVSVCAGSVSAATAQARGKFRAEVAEPDRLELAATREVGQVKAGVQAAAERYAGTAVQLIAAATDLPGWSERADAAAVSSLLSCLAGPKVGELPGLQEARPLPAVARWQPSARFSRDMTDATRKLDELARARREDITSWALEAGTQFRAIQQGLAETVRAAELDLTASTSALRDELTAALRIVEQRRAALGLD